MDFKVILRMLFIAYLAIRRCKARLNETKQSLFVQRDDLAMNFVFTSNVIATITTYAPISCGLQCARFANTQSLTYTSDMTSSNCVCYDEVMTQAHTSKTTQSGTALFVRKENSGKNRENRCLKLLYFFFSILSMFISKVICRDLHN